MPDTTTTDVPPRRNLPLEAEPWGREVENLTFENARQTAIAQQRLQAANRSTASQLASLSDQIARLSETTVYHEVVRTVTNTAGVNYTSEWTLTPPSWATAALVQATSLTVGTNTNTGGIEVWVLHDYGAIPPGGAWVSNVSVVDNTTSPQVNEAYSVYIPMADFEDWDGKLHSNLYFTRSSSGSGSASLTVGMTVTWL